MIKQIMQATLIAAALALAGCESEAERRGRIQGVVDHNQHELSSPTHIGTIANGTELYRLQILHPVSYNRQPDVHWVYFTSNGEITTNHNVQHGKTTVTETAASLKIQPNMTAEEVMVLAQEAIQKQENQERAELQRLLQKYGTP